MRKLFHNRFIRALMIIVSLSLIIHLSRDVLRLLKAGDQIRLAEQRVEELEREKRALLEKKNYYQSKEFVEEEARNKLNMARPGETIVILPPNFKELVGRREPKQRSPLPNWQRWWRLFF